MTTDAAIETESVEGNIIQAEGTQAIGEGSINLTEQTPQEKEKSDLEDRYNRIREKYNNDTDKIIKAYDEAQKELGRLKREVPQAPEAYEFTFDGIEGLPEDFEFDMDDPLLQDMLPVFKENAVTGKAAQEIANAFVKHQLGQQIDEQAEFAKLGADKDEIVNRLTNFSLSRLDETEREIFDSMTPTAEHVQLLNKIIGMTGEQPIAENVDARVPAKSAQEFRDEAFEYRAKHSKTISSSKAQQEHYHGLLQKAQRAEEKER